MKLVKKEIVLIILISIADLYLFGSYLYYSSKQSNLIQQECLLNKTLLIENRTNTCILRAIWTLKSDDSNFFFTTEELPCNITYLLRICYTDSQYLRAVYFSDYEKDLSGYRLSSLITFIVVLLMVAYTVCKYKGVCKKRGKFEGQAFTLDSS